MFPSLLAFFSSSNPGLTWEILLPLSALNILIFRKLWRQAVCSLCHTVRKEMLLILSTEEAKMKNIMLGSDYCESWWGQGNWLIAAVLQLGGKNLAKSSNDSF